jgi:predicted AAA+ superfamily ATPase
MLLNRHFKSIEDITLPGKVTIMYGARRVGKTTLLKQLLSSTNLRYKLESGENIRVRQILNSSDFDLLAEYVKGYDLIVIDEAQEVPDIGKGLKIIIDNNPELRVVATGSSSFHLSQKTGEPLTGRKREIRMFPFAHKELAESMNKFELQEKLNEFLVYGMYPEIFMTKSKSDKIELVTSLAESYLLKDVLSYENIKNSKMLSDLLKLLAFQIGNLVSFNELAMQLGVNVRTVTRYIELLEKSFVIFRLGALSRNLRSEVAVKSKYYFYDNGIRNAIINQFHEPGLRSDTGALWENFIITERMKKIELDRIKVQTYFWRNYKQQEIDYIEEADAQMRAYEIKWNKSKANFPGEFLTEYQPVSCEVIHKAKYFDFIF